MCEAIWIEGTHTDSCGRDYVLVDLLKKEKKEKVLGWILCS